MAGSGWDSTGVDASITVSGDGQTATRVGGHAYSSVRGLAGRSKGRRYFEITPDPSYLYDGNCTAGFMDANATLGVSLGAGSPISGGWRPAQGAFMYSYPNGSGFREDQDNVSAGVLGVLIDFDKKTCTVFRNGVIDWVEVMDVPDDTVLFPAVSLYHETAVALQTVEPFQYPPGVSFMAWDLSDSALATKVKGIIQVDGVAAARELKAFTFERISYLVGGSVIQESKPLGQTVSDPITGEYEIILRDGFRRDVVIVAFDDYGAGFSRGAHVSIGDRVHPTTPNGYVYACVGAGDMPETEPSTWPTDTEQNHLIGTASFSAVGFYRPQAHGPVTPEVFMGGVYWTPDMIEKELWLDASDIGSIVEQSGAAVSWLDKSGKGHTFSGSVSSSPKTGVEFENSLNVLRFDGTSHLLSSESPGIWKFLHDGTEHSIFLVLRAGNVLTQGMLFGLLSTKPDGLGYVGFAIDYDDRSSIGREQVVFHEAATGLASAETRAVLHLADNGFFPRNTFQGLGVFSSPANSVAVERSSLRKSGGEAVKLNTGTGNPVSNNPSRTLAIGALDGGSNNKLIGSVGEVIIIKSVIDVATREKVEGYLAHKWGYSDKLPSDHPYKIDPPKEQ